MTSRRMKPKCMACGETFSAKRARAGYKLCLLCGEEQAAKDRKSWCVLTPHKQGAMFFTAQSAREAAVGINNKGGLVTEGV
jgi:tRNA(Ile2) C34 agmatinyltransferase TiaS